MVGGVLFTRGGSGVIPSELKMKVECGWLI
jgi:hypothetical protein